jgi:anti-sigma-K factor RskA
VNIREYISSGVLEAYVLGELSPAERAAVEQNLSEYPELRQELAAIEQTQERLFFQTAITPPPSLREKILAQAQPTSTANMVEGRFNYWSWAFAASVVFALVASYLAFYYRGQWIESQVALNEYIAQHQQMAENYNTVNQRLDKLQSDLSIMENTQFVKVIMTGTENDPQAQASVYWNTSSEEVFVSIQSLKQISQENQYQLWALVDGKPVDAGVFDGHFEGLLKMKNIKGAQAFAVTVEPRGGLPAPTLSTMQVIGSLPKG